MPEHNNSEKVVEIKITQDKLVDILMHAATRDDIARLDAKIDSLRSSTRDDVLRLDSKIDRLSEKLDTKFTMLLTIYGIGFVTMLGILAKGFHWF